MVVRITIKFRVRILGITNPWRNGSASDSRPEGWGFKSLWVHSLASRAPLAERSAVNRQVLGSIPSGGVLFLAREATVHFWYPHGTWRTSLWPNGQGVGFRSRRLWVRVPPGMIPGFFCQSFVCRSSCLFTNCKVHSSSLAVEHRSYEPGVAGSIPAWSSACSVMVIIGASQALDPGSIPGRRNCELFHTGALAQSEECVLCKHEVRGSKPRCSILHCVRSGFPTRLAACGRAIALVAQLVEHGSNKPRVGGSSPSWSMSCGPIV